MVTINYRGGPGTFLRVPYHRVVSGQVPAAAFTGKIVLVGATSPVLHDVFRAPFAPAGDMPGVEIHANMLETLLHAGPLRHIPFWIVGLVTVGGGALAVWVGASLRLLPGTVLVTGAVAGYLVAVHAAFLFGRLWVEALPVPLALALGFVGTEIRNFIREQRERRRLSRFFSPQVVREIVRAQEGDEALGSGRRLLTVLFSDIRGFTALSERMPPEEVAEFLREYLTEMTDAVFAHGGTVDKYIGDAVMALYNVPFEAPDHAAQAVRTALEFQRRLRPLAERFAARHGGELRCGVGIHTGEAVVGTLGSRQRLEYTAIGDTINLGSRLEGLTKDYDMPIIISEATRIALAGPFVIRPLGEATVKGREETVKIYGVLGEAGGEELPEGRRGQATPRPEERRAGALVDGRPPAHELGGAPPTEGMRKS
jgi:adenylate cyclase